MKALFLTLLPLLSIFGAGQSHAGTWYYCDPLRAYYPTVQTCPAPWHPVFAPNPGPVPPQAKFQSPAATPVESSQGYKDGLKAREAWWLWRASISGSYLQGVDYWFSRRTLAQPGTCDEPVGVTDADPTFSQGCEDSKERLAAVDAKGKEFGFWRGWAAFKPSPADVENARKARTQAPADAGVDPAATQDAVPSDAAPPAGNQPPLPGAPPAQNGY